MNNFYSNSDSILAWLNKHKIEKFQLVPSINYGFEVIAKCDVNINNKNLLLVPVKFKEIQGNLNCSYNRLTNLKFCPSIVHGDFFCYENKLKSLKFSPHIIEGDFDCSLNQLSSLRYCPKHVEYNLICSTNNIIDLEFCPKEVGGFFHCDANPLLGELQKVTVFEEIHKEHLKLKAMKKLVNTLNIDLIEKKDNFKMKI